MGNRLYVGNLPFSADEQSVRELFAQDGREVTRAGFAPCADDIFITFK